MLNDASKGFYLKDTCINKISIFDFSSVSGLSSKYIVEKWQLLMKRNLVYVIIHISLWP